MRNLTRCIPLALAAGLLAWQSLDAQETAPPRTHTVVRGDNLWDLSQRYLADPFLWPEIYRLNRDIVEDPHWIYPGEVLRLPGAEPPVVAEAPQATPEEPSPVSPESPTIFSPRTSIGAAPAPQAPTGIINNEAPPTVRAGQVIVAPYVDREGGPRGFGRILKSGDLPGISEASDRSIFQAFDRVIVAPPVGQVAPEGQRYLAYRLGPILEDQGQVIIPTGIIEITRAPGSDVAAMGEVVRAFNELTSSDRLIPLDTAGLGTRVRPNRVANGPSTTITWIYGEPVLPNIQSFIVLKTSSNQGVHMGDEFLIYKPREKQERGQLDDPEIPIGKAQVVRATPYGVTAVIIGQEQPVIRAGMTARITAEMP